MVPRILPYVCLGYLLGIGFGLVYFPPTLVPILFFGLVFLMLAIFSRAGLFKVLLIFYCSVLIGGIQSGLVTKADNLKINQWKIVAKSPLVLEGDVTYVEQQDLVLKALIGNLKIPGTKEIFPGILEVRMPVTENVSDNSKVRLTGKIIIPDNKSLSAGHFDPQRYYARFGIYGTMNNPHIKVLEEGEESILTKTRALARSVLQKYLPEPSAGLFSATLLGYMHDVPQDLRNDFSASGLAHLVAISGQHVAMLAILVFFVGLRVGLSRNGAALLTFIASTIFISLVNYPPSGIRSVIMIAAVYAAYATGKKSSGLRILLLTCSLMVAINPRILLADLGFQLSALAMWGLIVFYPVLIIFLSKKSFWGKEIFLMTLSAMFTTTPIIGYAFGKISLVGIWANVLAGPIYPVLMCLGVLLIFFGWVPVLGTLIAVSAHYLTQLFLSMVTFSSKMPGTNIMLTDFSVKKLLIVYLAIFFMSLIISRETRLQFLPARKERREQNNCSR
jgi:competence protein ComEC